MTALEILNAKYKSTDIVAVKTTGILENNECKDLDCNCVDCGDDADCSTPW